MSKSNICVMGSFVVDLAARADHLPVKGETVFGSAFVMGPGGKGSNQAVAARRAGAEVVLITKIGKDVFGQVAKDSFIKEGLYSPCIFEDPDLETGIALIMVDKESANCILVAPGACTNIQEEEIEACREEFAACDILLTQLEVNLPATVQAIEMAKETGTTVILNPAPVQEIPDGLLEKVDIITPIEIEAAILAGIPAIETIEDCRQATAYFLEQGVSKVVITWGERGVYCNDGNRELHIPVLPVKAIDTTGAGDAFNGCFAAALAHGKDFFDAAVYATVGAGISVTRFGTAPSTAYECEIEPLYEQHKSTLLKK